MIYRSWISGALACCLLLACGGGSDGGGTEPKVLTSLVVTIATPSLQVGQSTTATVTGIDQNGDMMTAGTVTWSSGTTSVATVNATTGAIAAVGVGQSIITASAGGKTATGNVVVIAAAVSGKLRIAFARSATGAKCHRDDATGCDLYFTDVDMTAKTTVTPATAIATAAGVAEFFPALSSTGRFVVYNRIAFGSNGLQTSNDVWAADLTKPGSAALLITNARFPEISADDKKIYFSRPGTPRGDLYVAALTINESAGTISVGTITNLTGTITTFTKAEDPSPIGATSQVVFHYQVSDATPSVTAVLDAATGTYVPISDATGHPSISSAGTIAASPVSSGGISLATAKSGGGWNTATSLGLPATPNLLASADTAYNTRSVARWGYTQWVDDGHIISSVMAGSTTAGVTTFTMSRLFLVTVNGTTFELLTTLLGGVYADYCTAAVRKLN